MPKSHVYIALMGICMVGCGQSKRIAYDKHTIPINTQLDSHTNQISICALDLSEDFSALSTKNDEILFLIYSLPTLECRYILSHTFGERQSCKTFDIDTNLKQTITYVLIEKDTERNDTFISENVVSQLDSLAVFHHRSDYTKIRTVLGDDDLLDINTISLTDSTKSVSAKGIHKMDKYHYFITFDLND